MALKVMLEQVASRADRVYVFSETQSRSTQFAKQLGYHPNQLARNVQGECSFTGAYFWVQTSPNQINHIDGFIHPDIHFNNELKHFCLSVVFFWLLVIRRWVFPYGWNRRHIAFGTRCCLKTELILRASA